MIMISQKSLLQRSLPIIIQCASVHRKPRWLPVAKSKIYRIPKRPEVDKDESLELLRIHNNYKTQMRAIRRFYFEEMIKEQSTLQSTSSDLSQKLEADDWARCIKLNEKWSAQVAAEREVRRAKELAAMEEKALARMEAMDKERRVKMEKASEEIRKQKELSTKFITLETLDEAIDNAIANPVDYNYAIDLKGNQTQGRETPVTDAIQQKSSINA